MIATLMSRVRRSRSHFGSVFSFSWNSPRSQWSGSWDHKQLLQAAKTHIFHDSVFFSERETNAPIRGLVFLRTQIIGVQTPKAWTRRTWRYPFVGEDLIHVSLTFASRCGRLPSVVSSHHTSKKLWGHGYEKTHGMSKTEQAQART